MRSLFLIVPFIIVLISCEEEELSPECHQDSIIKSGNPISRLDFPDCQLIEERFVASYGTTENTYYYYDEEWLVRRDFYANGKYNSTKLYGYNALKELEYMFIADSLGQVEDTLVSYDFCNGLLIRSLQYDLNNNQVAIQTLMTYKYDRISEIEVVNSEDHIRYHIDTDDFGNPVEVSVIELNGQTPSTSYRYVYKYDDKFNPFYRFPDFISDSYFAQNNVIESNFYINDEEQVDFDELVLQYNENGLLSKSSDGFSQGMHTVEYLYKCN